MVRGEFNCGWGMASRKPSRHRLGDAPRGTRPLGTERLEPRCVLTAGIDFDPATRILSIVGSNEPDIAEIRQRGVDIVVSLDSGGGTFTRTIPAASVERIVFAGLAGGDVFTNLSGTPSRAMGGPGADVLRGGSAADELLGGGGKDRLLGDLGNDVLDGGGGDDAADGGFGDDRLMGGLGNDVLEGGDGIDALWGGVGDDEIVGGRGGDSIWGEDGNDRIVGNAGSDMLSGGKGGDDLSGGAGSDMLDAGEGDDDLDGQLGADRLIGGAGLDRESDVQDLFEDGDADGDGFDDDYDAFDILFESPGNPRAYADDTAAVPIIDAVTTELRRILQLPAADDGLRVRVHINDGAVTQPGRFGDLVTGVWRYLTPDKIQVWARWCYPAADPSQLKTFAEYSYNGPYSGDIADYGNPAYYTVSDESRIYAGYLRGAVTFISWLPGQPVGFFYSAPNEQATGLPAPIERLTALLGSRPNFSATGDSFSGSLAAEPGFVGIQPILDLLRSIEQVNRTWYAELRAARRR